MSGLRIAFVNRDILARSAPQRWAEQYPHGHRCGENKNRIGEALAREPSLNADAVNRIIGNDSWTTTYCDLCAQKSLEWLDVCGEYESAAVCLDCAAKIAAAIPEQKEPK